MDFCVSLDRKLKEKIEHFISAVVSAEWKRYGHKRERERERHSRCHLLNEFSASFHSHFILSAQNSTATQTPSKHRYYYCEYNTPYRGVRIFVITSHHWPFVCIVNLPLMHLFNGCALSARHCSCSIPKKTNRITDIEWSCHWARCTKETHISYWKEAVTIACVELWMQEMYVQF